MDWMEKGRNLQNNRTVRSKMLMLKAATVRGHGLIIICWQIENLLA